MTNCLYLSDLCKQNQFGFLNAYAEHIHLGLADYVESRIIA